MTETELINLFLEKVEDILYMETPVSDSNIVEIIVGILENEYDI